jgi:predicted NBD/HSP70 family sugar kinase
VTQTTPPRGPQGRPLRPVGKLLQEDARRHHRSLLLQRLFRDGAASRADLARTTGLTRVTVSDLVGELVADGLVVELGAPAETRVGKPPMLVGIASDATHVVALDLSGVDEVVGALVDLAGTVVTRVTRPLADQRGADATALVVDLVDELVRTATVPVLGVGVGSPGVVDALGTVLEAPNLGWVDEPLAARLSEHTGLPTFVANDANAAALGEHTFGGAVGGGLMVLRVGTGVGAGLVLEGTLLHGHRAAAGEIGHVVVDPSGHECACGRRGCLETLLAVPHLQRRLDAVRGEATRERRVLGDTGRRLGAALSPVVATLNLHDLVLSGPPELLDGPLRAAVESTIRARTMPVTADELRVRTSTLGDDVVLSGATVLVLAGVLGVS